MTFNELNISKQILMALEDAGFEQPTPIQERAFPVIRSGKDVIGIAQTGTGKTLAYLIPLLMKLHYAQGNYPRALVIVPTRELVVQVCESVELLTEYMDIRCVGIYGGTNIRTQQAAVYEGVDDKLPTKLFIGQGWREFSENGIGIGRCTSKFENYVRGCPPSSQKTYEFLKEFICNNQNA